MHRGCMRRHYGPGCAPSRPPHPPRLPHPPFAPTPTPTRSGRKRASLAYVATYALSCATKHSGNYWVLMVGQGMGGWEGMWWGCGRVRNIGCS